MTNKYMSELKDRVDLRELIEDLEGAPIRRGSKYWTWRSPLRDDRNATNFQVYPNRFRDFASHEGGDVFDFLIRTDRASDTSEAIQYVLRWLGEDRARKPTRDRTVVAQREQPQQTDEWRIAAEKLVATAQEYLWSDAPDAQRALTYLRGRGLSDKTIQMFRLGYNPKMWATSDYVRPDGRGGWSRAGLAAGIVIPWWVNGQIVAVRVRMRIGKLAEALDLKAPDSWPDGRPIKSKYLSFANSVLYDALYIANEMRPGRPVLITEGEFDAILAAQILGDTYSVITLGSASGRLNQHWNDAITAIKQPVYLATDDDEAGNGARAKLVAALDDCSLFAVEMPTGINDLTDAVVAGHDLANLITDAHPVSDPVLDILYGRTVNLTASERVVPENPAVREQFPLPDTESNRVTAITESNLVADNEPMELVGHDLANGVANTVPLTVVAEDQPESATVALPVQATAEVVMLSEGLKGKNSALSGDDLASVMADTSPLVVVVEDQPEPATVVLSEGLKGRNVAPGSHNLASVVKDQPEPDIVTQTVAETVAPEDLPLLTFGHRTERLLLALPDSWREGHSLYMHPAIPVIVDTVLRLNREGKLSLSLGVTRLFDVKVTRGDLLDAGLTRGTVDRGLDELSKAFTQLTRIRGIHIEFKCVNEPGVFLFQATFIREILEECARYRITERFFPVPSSDNGAIAYGGEDVNDLVFSDMIAAIDPLVDGYAIERRVAAVIEGLPGFRQKLLDARATFSAFQTSLDDMTCHMITEEYHSSDDYGAVCLRAMLGPDGAQLPLARVAAIAGCTSAGGARSVRDRAGLEVVPVYVDEVVSSGKLATILDAPCSARFDRKLAGHAQYARFEYGGEMQQYRLPAKPQSSFSVTLKTKASYFERIGGKITVGYRQADHMRVVTEHLPQRAKRRVTRNVLDRVPDAAEDAAKAARAAIRSDHRRLFSESQQPYYGLGHDPHWAYLQLRALLLLVSSWQSTGSTLSKHDRETGELIAAYEDTPANVLLLLVQDPTDRENWPSFISVDRTDDDAVVALYKRHGSAFRCAFRAWEADQSAIVRRAAMIVKSSYRRVLEVEAIFSAQI